MSSGCARAEALVLSLPGLELRLSGDPEGLFRPRLPARRVVRAGRRQGRSRSLHNIGKVAAVTTYGGSRFRAILMGDPPRKLVKRLLRATVKPGAPVSYLAHYSMNLSTDQSRRKFMEKVAASNGRVLMRVPGRLLPSGAGELLRSGARCGGRGARGARLGGAAGRPLRRTVRSGAVGRRAPQLQRSARPPIPALDAAYRAPANGPRRSCSSIRPGGTGCRPC